MAIIHDGNSVPISQANPLPTSLVGSDVQVPVDIQSRYSMTVATHAGTMIAPASWSLQATFLDCNGFSEIAATLLNDNTTSSSATVFWSNDGVAIHGEEVIVATSSLNRKAGIVPIKARYAKITVNNADAAPHTISVWAYLKA